LITGEQDPSSSDAQLALHAQLILHMFTCTYVGGREEGRVRKSTGERAPTRAKVIRKELRQKHGSERRPHRVRAQGRECPIGSTAVGSPRTRRVVPHAGHEQTKQQHPCKTREYRHPPPGPGRVALPCATKALPCGSKRYQVSGATDLTGINLPLPSSSPVAKSRVSVELVALPPARTIASCCGHNRHAAPGKVCRSLWPARQAAAICRGRRPSRGY